MLVALWFMMLCFVVVHVSVTDVGGFDAFTIVYDRGIVVVDVVIVDTVVVIVSYIVVFAVCLCCCCLCCCL